MKNGDDFWKRQFVKHEVTPSTEAPPSNPVPTKSPSKATGAESKAISTAEEAWTLRMEKILLKNRSAESTLRFETVVALALSKVPAKTRAHWERWLLDRKAVLVNKWGLSDG
jgi:hypothetical protein